MAWQAGIAQRREKCRNGERTAAGIGLRHGSSLEPRAHRTERVSGMAHSRRVTTASAALLLGVLAGCSEDPARTTSPPEPTTDSTPSTGTPASEPPSDSEMAEQAASQLMRGYYATVDRLRQDPTQPLSQLRTVANGGQLEAQTIFTRNQRKAGNRQAGGAQVVVVVVQSVNLNSSGQGQIPTVQLDVCWDVSAVDVLDRDGRSIVSPERPDRGWTRYTVANHQWKTSPDDGWRVVSGRDLEKAPCSAA